MKVECNWNNKTIITNNSYPNGLSKSRLLGANGDVTVSFDMMDSIGI